MEPTRRQAPGQIEPTKREIRVGNDVYSLSCRQWQASAIDMQIGLNGVTFHLIPNAIRREVVWALLTEEERRRTGDALFPDAPMDPG